MMDSVKPIRAGIIGLGKMGQLRARELARRDDVRLVCGYDPAPDAFRNEWPDVTCVPSIAALVTSALDVVFVCTPNRFTPDAIVAALEAGKHVFSEKPPGCTVDDIRRIRTAEAQCPGQKLAFGFNHRHHAGIQEAYRIATSGRLGEILWIRGVYGKAGGVAAWRGDPDIVGGGILLDQGIHLLDLVRMFLGDIIEVKSMVTAAHWEASLEDNAFALLRDGQGRIAQVHSSSTQWKHRFNFEIYLSKGYLSVDGILTGTRSYGDETLTIARKAREGSEYPGAPMEETVYFDEDPSWAVEIETFLACVRSGQPVKSGSSEQALRAMELVYAIYGDDGEPTRRK
jgi:predicted dehydrogenase